MGLLFGDGGAAVFGDVSIADDELATVVEGRGGVEALLGFDEGKALFRDSDHEYWF